MADLAGFDVIGEIHIDTIVDLVNLQPITNPLDGSSIYLLGGPFSTDLNVDMGPLGVVTVRLILDVRLVPVLHQSIVQLSTSIKGGSTAVAGRSVNHIGGEATLPVSLGFALLPALPGIPLDLQVPVLMIGAAPPTVVLDSGTRTLADTTLGPGGADLLTNGVRDALSAFFAAVGTRAIPALGFIVAPGIDSADPRQLSATPTVAWIDGTTLGVFGYYRAAATGGNVNAKTTGDLEQGHQEFFYGQSGLASVLPGRRHIRLPCRLGMPSAAPERFPTRADRGRHRRPGARERT
jgi:hypothetical protein